MIKEEKLMSKGHGVSGNNHTQQQRDHYANQNNSNNSAHQAKGDNRSNQMNPNNVKSVTNNSNKK